MQKRNYVLIPVTNIYNTINNNLRNTNRGNLQNKSYIQLFQGEQDGCRREGGGGGRIIHAKVL